MEKCRIGLIGFGRMGEAFLNQVSRDERWEIVSICDISEAARQAAEEAFPQAKVTAAEDDIFNDPTVNVVGLFALADSREGQVRRAVAAGKHIVAEKPIANRRLAERRLVALVEGSGLISTVDLYLRNSWYHNELKDFVKSGEIGELAILRVCHMTPGLVPGEGHEYEGPCFHDCGMHYVDILRWYAESEFKTWNAQGMRMWGYKDPWWLTCSGTFANGVVFNVTQGFVYGQLSKDQTHNSYIDIIGTKGIARMTHDFKTAVVELRGVGRTERIKRPYGGKNMDVLCEKFAQAVISGRADPSLPTFRDAMIASEYSWKFLEDAAGREMPSVGTEAELEEIRQRRSCMTNGYGLLPKRSRGGNESK